MGRERDWGGQGMRKARAPLQGGGNPVPPRDLLIFWAGRGRGKQEPGSHRCGPAVWPPLTQSHDSLSQERPREGSACPQLALPHRKYSGNCGQGLLICAFSRGPGVPVKERSPKLKEAFSPLRGQRQVVLQTLKAPMTPK